MPGSTCAVHQPNFFPRLSTLAKLYAADVWVILDDVQFSRRDYQHRCYLPAAGPASPARWLTVPVHLPAGRPTRIKDARIADPALTARRMRGLLGQYFRKSPHRTAIRDLLAEADDAVTSSARIAELSERTTTALLKAVGWRGRICRSSCTIARSGRSERLADLTKAAGATDLAEAGPRELARHLDNHAVGRDREVASTDETGTNSASPHPVMGSR